MEEIREEVNELRQMIVRCNNFIYLGRLYDNWNDSFAWKEANRYFKMLEEETLKVDIMSLSDAEMEALGFAKWDANCYLIPAQFYKAAIAQGIMKEGESTDTRFGMFFRMIPKKRQEIVEKSL